MRSYTICGRTAQAALTAFLVGACGGEADQPETAATPRTATTAATQDACALLPASEVTAVIGETVRDSLAMRMAGGDGAVQLSQCNYATASNPAAVSLMLRRSAAGDTGQAALQSIRESIAQVGVTVEDVPGLGEGAIWGGNQLHVITNKGWSIVVSPPASGGLAQARALAERALARL